MNSSCDPPPKLNLAPDPSPGAAFAEEVISAFRVAVREAQAAHFRAGDSIVIEKDGQLVYIDPPTEEEIETATPLAA